MTAPHDIGHSSPRLVFFRVAGRRELARKAAAAAPGLRFAVRRSWTKDPGEQQRPLFGGEPPVGLWHWGGCEEEFVAQARCVLLHFVHPLIARGLPYCLGFSFGPEVLAPRSAAVGEAAALDLEDIGRLLGVTRPGVRPFAGETPAARRDPTCSARPATGPDATRLDDAQRAAVLHDGGPARVLAPAGSGKTKTLVSRVVELVERGADPSDILMLAFNRKAAEQLEERLAALGIPTTRRLGAPPVTRLARMRRRDAAEPPDRPSGVHCATFNAFGHRYQREVMRARVSLDHDGRALRALMARALETAGISLHDLRPRRGSDPVGAFMRALARVRVALEPADRVQVTLECVGTAPLVTLPFAPTHAQFTRAQATTGLQSFDDQIWFAVADLHAEPEHRAFAQQRFEHVLVDEFQDLNGAQLALVDVLSRPLRQLFVVGDDDQLIYGWRQADPRGILEFHSRMPPRPFSATYTLCTNYRCSRAVVETGARLVANNLVREAKDIRPRAGAQAGAVRFAGAPAWPVRAEAICSFLLEEKTRMACDWRDLAVLCRYRSQQLPVALALDAAGIPRTAALGCTLFTHPAATLLRTCLALVLEPRSLPGPALAAVLQRQPCFVGAAVLDAVTAAAEPWEQVQAAAGREPRAGPRPLSALVELVAALHAELAARPPSTGDLLWTVVEAFGLDDQWAAEADGAAAEGASDGGGPLEVLDALLLLADAYPEPGVCLATWDRLRDDEAAHAGSPDDTLGSGEAEDDRIVIGTIHAAKGREYHSVVIPDYDCDVSRWSPAEIEEERRVVYVGVTRARDAVLFTVDTSVGFVHPFLRELVEEPGPGEHATLAAWLDGEREDDVRALIRDRLAEIEVLYPECVPGSSSPGGTADGGDPAVKWSTPPPLSPGPVS
jgi:DNA helicase-2/ATP-dependent DNA helicase PcrA